MSVSILKLLSGDELLAEIVPRVGGSNPNAITIKNPVRIIVMPNKLDPKTPNIGFAPWAEFSDDKTFTLDKSHVVVIMSPIKQFVEQYNSMFSKIVTPQPGLILPS